MRQRPRLNWLGLRHRLEYLAFRAVVCLIDAIPARHVLPLTELAAKVIHSWLPRRLTRYHVARENLKIAFGDRYSDREIDRIIYRMWVHLFRMVVEIVQIPRKLRLYNCADLLSFRHRDELVRAMCTGRPIMIIGGHFGNWEIATATLGVFGFPVGIVARDLDNPYLHEWFTKSRIATGHRLISKKGGGSDMVAFLERRGTLALLGDQDAGSGGLFVPFFGRDASTFKSIALLAMQFRALICVGYAQRLPDDFRRRRWFHYEVGCEEIIDPDEFTDGDAIRQITERYTAALERVISRAPEQYFWVHRRWKSVPKQRGRRKRAEKKAA